MTVLADNILTLPINNQDATPPTPPTSQVATNPKEKCQYKTGKCMYKRALKRNGELHSLCEEHRLKQNLIQRRSDRKYQTQHAERRRKRTQDKALKRKQRTMAMAQDFYYRQHQSRLSMIDPTAQMCQMFPATIPVPHLPSTFGVQLGVSSPTGVNELYSPTSIPSSPSSAASELTTEDILELDSANLTFDFDENKVTLDVLDIDLDISLDPCIEVLPETPSTAVNLWSEDDMSLLHDILLQ